MNWLLSILLGLLTGALGVFCAGAIAAACTSWYRVSNFEGGAGFMVVFIAIGGGIVGFFLGLTTARIVTASAAPGFGKAFGISWGIVLAISGITTCVCWLLADIPPKIDGQELSLEAELRLPVGQTNSPANASGETSLALGSVVRHVQRKSERGKLDIAQARLEGGRWIIPGAVYLFTMRGLRSVDFMIGGESCGFIIPLPARPSTKFEQWSDWFPDPPPGKPPWPETKPSCRFRVQRIVPPPPPPDPEVVKAEKFAALMPEAPLSDWLEFFEARAPEQRLTTIATLAQQRPTELAQLIRSPDSRLREPALSAVEWFTHVSPEISEAVLAEGREVAAGVRRFNEMKSDEPRFYDVQVELRTRFSHWRHAWWRVHQRTGVDGRPPVQEILDLALVRSKDTSMDEIVINARAHLDALKTQTNQGQ